MREDVVATALDHALSGRYSHPDPQTVISDLHAEAAGALPEGFDRTVHELLGHLVFWQDVTTHWLEGTDPGDLSDPDDSWPAGPRPGSPSAWESLVRRFADGLSAARAAAAAGNLEDPVPGVPEGTRIGVLQVLATHNSWHLGQIVQVRRALGLWPPA